MNPNDVELTLRALKKHNLANKVHVVRDGAEALEFIFAEGDYTGGKDKGNSGCGVDLFKGRKGHCGEL
jgi:two-component system response regulator